MGRGGGEESEDGAGEAEPADGAESEDGAGEAEPADGAESEDGAGEAEPAAKPAAKPKPKPGDAAKPTAPAGDAAAERVLQRVDAGVEFPVDALAAKPKRAAPAAKPAAAKRAAPAKPAARRGGTHGSGVLQSSGDEFDEDEERAKEAATKKTMDRAKKAAAKERDAAKAADAKKKLAAIQAKEDAELAANQAAAQPVTTTRVVRKEIVALAAMLVRWKDMDTDDPEVANSTMTSTRRSCS